jgi:hypothetical protein
MVAATTSPHDSDAAIPITDMSSCHPEVIPAGSPGRETGEATAGPTDLTRDLVEWGAAHYAPLDTAALDPPSACDRCQRPIRPDDPIDYLVAEDGSVAIVHESCSGSSVS